MDWNSVQQLIRIGAQLGAGALVSQGIITEDLATSGVGAIVSIASIVWWIAWEGKRKDEVKQVADENVNTEGKTGS